jgi:hypothetical protein
MKIDKTYQISSFDSYIHQANNKVGRVGHPPFVPGLADLTGQAICYRQMAIGFVLTRKVCKDDGASVTGDESIS